MPGSEQSAVDEKDEIAEIEKSWAERGFSCAMWIDAPGQCWEDFVHDMDELLCVVQGELEFEMNGKITRPAPWDEVFIPAGAKHSVRNRGNSVARWLYGYKK